MVIGTRIKERLKALGKTQAQLARAIGVSPQAVSKMVNSDTTDTPKLYQIAKFLETTPEYLLGETDDPSLPEGTNPQRSRPVRTDDDTVELEEFDVSYGLGASYIHDTPVTGRKRVFSRSWIRNFTDSPFECLFWGTGVGDSMTPTIQDADVVLIDTFERTPRFIDKLWAIEFGGLGAIKRLRPTADGTGMRMLSSAPDVPEEVAYDGEMTIIGRVVAIVRKV